MRSPFESPPRRFDADREGKRVKHSPKLEGSGMSRYTNYHSGYIDMDQNAAGGSDARQKRSPSQPFRSVSADMLEVHYYCILIPNI